MDQKLGDCAPFGEGELDPPSNTMRPGPGPTFLPSDILIHPAIWPQQTWAENWGMCPFGGWGAASPERGTAAPSFRPMFIVAKQSPIAATAELLLWPPYVIGQAIIFLPCDFYLLSIFFFPRLISAV